MNTFYLWVGYIVCVVATLTACLIVTGKLLEEFMKALRIHRIVLRYIWYERAFTAWYLKEKQNQRQQRKRMREGKSPNP